MRPAVNLIELRHTMKFKRKSKGKNGNRSIDLAWDFATRQIVNGNITVTIRNETQ